MNRHINHARGRHALATVGLLAIACLLSSTAQAQRPSIAGLQAQITAQQAQINSGTIPNVAGYVTMDVSNPSRPTLRVAGANVQVVNGLGSTATINGLGNVIVGYDEASSIADMGSVCSIGNYTDEPTCTTLGGTWQVEHKEGSHNLVVGPSNRYSRYGGLVAGYGNTANNDIASVSGGAYNTASATYASVSGGYGNAASNQYSSVSGGVFNTASGAYASVSGGYGNAASNQFSSVSGGWQNIASADYASVSGGRGCNTGSTTYLWSVGAQTGGCSTTLHNY